jgi:acyl dehydratase
LKTYHVSELFNLIGSEVGVSKWIKIDQERINNFAKITEDQQFIHVDPKRAISNSPFGGTIAHGFLTASMLSSMAFEAQPKISGVTMVINYGFDSLRFISPLPSGSEIRGKFTLSEVTKRKETELMIKWDVTIEIMGQLKPAMVAKWINLLFLDGKDK